MKNLAYVLNQALSKTYVCQYGIYRAVKGSIAMQSPLSVLCEVLIEVKRRASDYAPSNEAQTRTALINPVLEALGWNLSNSEEVELEKRFTSGRDQDIIDYILKGDGHIIVEAKKLGSDLDNHFRQILLYAAGANAKSIFLTDGLIWRHYTNPHAGEGQTNSMNFSEVNRIKLGEIDDNELPSKAASYFVQHLDASLYVKKKSNRSIESDLRLKVAELEQAIKAVETVYSSLSSGLAVVQNLSEPVIPDLTWKILGDNSWDPKSRRPKRLRLPNNEVVEVNGWAQVLSETCHYCLQAKPELITALPIIDKAGRSQNLIGKDRPANNYTQLTAADQVVYVNTTYSAVAAVANAAYMLEKISIDQASKAAVLLAE